MFFSPRSLDKSSKSIKLDSDDESNPLKPIYIYNLYKKINLIQSHSLISFIKVNFNKFISHQFFYRLTLYILIQTFKFLAYKCINSQMIRL